MVSELKRAWPAIDILVCNAANPTQLPIDDWTPELFDSLIATNLKGPFFLIKSLLPLFSGRSSIILIGSISALIGHRHSAAYGASKAGLTALASGLSYELKDRGIRVNGISPGPIVTNAFKRSGPRSRPHYTKNLQARFRSKGMARPWKSPKPQSTLPRMSRLSPSPKSCAWTAA
jgi:NAD(P)-dependent dehydrogenase (short-subunit alcohol dehydrogenase family)